MKGNDLFDVKKDNEVCMRWGEGGLLNACDKLSQFIYVLRTLFLGAVIPKYGRIVIFRNIIDHSARPPSPDFLAARYTFAVKV